MALKRNDTEIIEWVIYKITSPSGRIYIGKTSDFDSRVRDYITINCKNQHIIYNSLKKYGYDSHKIDVIEKFNSDINYCNGKEMFWIRAYMSNYSKWPEMKGMNLTDGGEGTLGRKSTKEQRKRMSDAKKANPSKRINFKHTLETKEKLSIFHRNRANSKGYVSPRKGVKLTEEQKKHLSDINKGSTGFWKGKKLTQEHIDKVKESKKKLFESGYNMPTKGKKRPAEHSAKMSKILKGKKAWNKGIKSSEATKKKLSDYWKGRPNINNRKRIFIYNTNYKFIKDVIGMDAAANFTGLSKSTILRQMNGSIKNPRKYMFKYNNDVFYKEYLFENRFFKTVDLSTI